MSLLSIATTYAARKLAERTTWVGIIGFSATKLGIVVSPELTDAIATVGLAVMSAVLIWINEHKAAPAPAPQPSRADGAPLDAVLEARPIDKGPVSAQSGPQSRPISQAGVSVAVQNPDGSYSVRGPDGLTRHVVPTGRSDG